VAEVSADRKFTLLCVELYALYVWVKLPILDPYYLFKYYVHAIIVFYSYFELDLFLYFHFYLF